MTSTDDAPTAGAFWQQHLAATQAWIGSSYRSSAAGARAAQVLAEWLNALPEHSADVCRLALSSAFTAQTAGSTSLVVAFTTVVLDAWFFQPASSPAVSTGSRRGVDGELSVVLAALLHADASAASDNLQAARRSLSHARLLLGHATATQPLHAWARAQLSLIEGLLAESLLERRAAAAHYRRALALAEPLVRTAATTRALAHEWLRLCFGDSPELAEQDAAAVKLLERPLHAHMVRAALGVARNTSHDDAASAAHAAARMCEAFGIPSALGATEVHAALEHLDGAVRIPALDALLASRLDSTDRKEQALVAMLYGMRGNSTDASDAHADFAQANAALTRAADALSWTTVAYDRLDYLARTQGDASTASIELFMTCYRLTEKSLRGTLQHLPFRAYAERALHRATDAAIAQYVDSGDDNARARLSACLETTRTTDEVFTDRTDHDRATPVQRARTLANDWLGRIAQRLEQSIRHEASEGVGLRDAALASTLVLIPTATARGTTFVVVTAQGGLELCPALDGFETAADSLSVIMRSFLDQQTVDEVAATATLDAAAHATWSSIPSRVQHLIESHATLLISPDLSAARADMPWELVRNTRGYLGTTQVIARAPSLRALTTILETPTRNTVAPARALCVAAPEAIPSDPLPFATPERDRLVQTLHARGAWDVPELSSDDLSASSMLRGLRAAALVHVAAHADVDDGMHSVWLSPSERLSTADVLSAASECAAITYLNVCSVGASDYLGGGASRGLAAALLQRGAPAVVASQLPVYDTVAAEMAEAFYRHALTLTVGDAMRHARVAASAAHAPDAWGALLLFGDPWRGLGDSEHIADGRNDHVSEKGNEDEDASDDLAVSLLRCVAEFCVGLRAPETQSETLTTRLMTARESLHADPAQLRLNAALECVEGIFAFSVEEGEPTPSAAEALALCALARDLGAPDVEAVCQQLAATALRSAAAGESDMADVGGGEDDSEAAANLALDRAISLAERIALSEPAWRGVVQALLAERERADLDVEAEAFDAGGLSVNDRSDPTVAAFFEIQYSVDRQSARLGDLVEPRLHEQSLSDACYNIVVMGQLNRFVEAHPSEAVARQWVLRAIERGWIPDTMQLDAQRVAAGLLYFLYSAQRITHLEPERASAQAETLRLALTDDEAFNQDATADGVTLRERLLAHAMLQDAVAEPPSVKFARALQAIETLQQTSGAAVPASPAQSLGAVVEAYIEGAPAGSRTRAHRTAWAHGVLLQRMSDLAANGKTREATAIRLELESLASRTEDDLRGYLLGGFEFLSQRTRLSALSGWR